MSAAPQESDSLGLPFDYDIAIEDSAWDEVLDPDPICERAFSATLAQLSDPKIGELSIALIDDNAMQALNQAHRGKNKSTNVLSFPAAGPAPILGDIVIARETLVREAAGKKIDAVDHFTHLLIHGFLHLQGYDHENETDAEAMEALEIAALARLGIDNPYQIKEPLKS